jgi:VIT1/CCC1 family predicted Fe2+/Mn2+ transporter
VSGLLIVALADNLSDSLSIHIYQEAEHLEAREAFRSTLTNFVTRLLVSLTFVLLILTLPVATAALVSVIWGGLLLVALSIVIARQRLVSAVSEIGKHLVAAGAVLFLSRTIGVWIPAHFH